MTGNPSGDKLPNAILGPREDMCYPTFPLDCVVDAKLFKKISDHVASRQVEITRNANARTGHIRIILSWEDDQTSGDIFDRTERRFVPEGRVLGEWWIHDDAR